MSTEPRAGVAERFVKKYREFGVVSAVLGTDGLLLCGLVAENAAPYEFPRLYEGVLVVLSKRYVPPRGLDG